MTYERYDVGTPQSGARRTAPNVDRVMGLGASSETTVDRLLTVVERLTAELATTQSALHDLALEVARAGIGEGAPPAARAALSSGTVPMPSAQPSALPPRRADHAVIPEIDTYVPGTPAPQTAAGAARAAADGGTPDTVDASAPVEPAQPVGPSAAQQRAAEASAAAASSVAAAAAAAQAAQAAAAQQSAAAQQQNAAAQQQQAAAAPVAQPPVQATYGGPTNPPAPPAPAAPAGLPLPSEAPRADVVASLNDVQLLSAGAVDVMLGPVRDLADLDTLETRILALQSVEAVTVMAFEGRDVLVKIEIDRPMPLASMLRTDLGRPVESCRLVEGRIVVTFAETEAVA